MKALPLDYDPRCTLYKRKSSWWLKYYLPSGYRMRRSCDRNQQTAKQKLRIKQNQLLQGIFDDEDLTKLEGTVFYPKQDNARRLTITEAVQLYLELSSARKEAKTQYDDAIATTNQFKFFQEKLERTYMDEIRPVDVQLLVSDMDKRGLSEATMCDYVACVSKCFNWLLNMKELDCDNPVTAMVSVPKKEGKVRDRVPTDLEIQRLFRAFDHITSPQSAKTPLYDIFSFLLFTGARLGECLHCEWQDFDFAHGIWKIQSKPRCPTRFGLGWKPKRDKYREVPLFPEALAVLQRMPHHETVGKVPVRDEQGRIVNHTSHAAHFVFPRQVVRRINGVRHVSYERVDSVKNSWGTLKKKANVDDLRLHDLRRYFNTFLKNHCLFSAKEAGAYVGNTDEVNDRHYTAINLGLLSEKIQQISLSEAIGIEGLEEVAN